MDLQGFYDFTRLYRTRTDSSPRIYDLTPVGTPLIIDPAPERFAPEEFPATCKTPFEGIEIENPIVAASIQTLSLGRYMKEREREVPDYSPDDIYSGIWEQFKRVIFDNWNSDKMKVIYHSSGWDSRYLSCAIHELYKEHGPAWLGPIIFFEMFGEHTGFYEIMKIQNWGRFLCKSLSVYNFGPEGALPPGELHRASYEFDSAWARLNCFHGYPINYWLDPLYAIWGPDWAEFAERAQFWSALAANRMTEMIVENRFLEHIQRYYYRTHAHTPKVGQWIFPFCELNFIHYIWKNLPANLSSYREPTVRKLYPEVAAVKYESWTAGAARGYRNVGSYSMGNIVRDYWSSWYALERTRLGLPQPAPTNELKFNAWWLHWSLASTAEAYRKQGFEVKFGV